MNVPSRSQIKNENAMKHTYSISVLTAAAALSMLAFASSCTKVSIDGYGRTEQYIGFSSMVVTKALVESADDMNEFAVWGYYADADGNYVGVFGRIGQEDPGVEVRKENGNWVYDDLRCWQFGVPYDFFAVYPADVPGVSLQSAVEPLLTVTGYNISANTEADLMLATASDIIYQDGDVTQPVSFRFSHLLSRIDLVCRPYSEQTVDGYEPRVHSAKLYGLGTEASFSSGQFTAGNAQRNGWTVSEETLTTENSPFAEATIPAGGQEINVRTELMSDVLVFPQQTFRPGMAFKVEWSATGDGTTRSSVIELISLPLEAWVGGKHYVYTFTISPEGRIIFDTPSVQKWDEAVGGIIIVE